MALTDQESVRPSIDSTWTSEVAWVVAKTDYDSYEIVGIFTDRGQAEAVHDELDLTPTGKSRGIYGVDAYPLNPRTAADARSVADVL